MGMAAKDIKTRVDVRRILGGDEIDALTAPITMQDVRLSVGEGKLTAIDILNGVNAVLRLRARHTVSAAAANK